MNIRTPAVKIPNRLSHKHKKLNNFEPNFAGKTVIPRKNILCSSMISLTLLGTLFGLFTSKKSNAQEKNTTQTHSNDIIKNNSEKAAKAFIVDLNKGIFEFKDGKLNIINNKKKKIVNPEILKTQMAEKANMYKNVRKRVIEIAESYKGIKETHGDNLSAEVSLFQEDIDWLKGKPWCASFASYCYKTAVEEQGFTRPFEHTPSTYKFSVLAKQNGWFHENTKDFIPQTGDIILMDRLVTKLPYDHTALVVSYNKKTHIVTTIEGNLDETVKSRQILKDELFYKNGKPFFIKAFVRPE